jgi:4,5-dihydroxyphthalate decarboxylase
MSDIRLSLAINPYDRALPLISREVEPDGVELSYQGMPGGNGGVFYDQLKFARYDVSEMSISSYLIARAAGWPYLMLPIFHNRNFSYTDLVIRDASGIRVDHPEDLVGKRFSIRDYQQSAGLWIRGVLADEFGVRPEQMEWSQTRARDYSLTGASGSKPPVPIRFTDADVGLLMDRGEIDVTWSGKVVPKADRGVLSGGDVDVRGRPGVSTLFSDPKAEGLRYFRKTGHFPIHHTTVVREQVLKDHPWVATSLLEAFERSKRMAAGRMTNQSLFVFGDHLRKEVLETFNGDPYPYGIRQNASTIDYVQNMSVEQGLTTAKQDLSEIFASETLLL